MQLTKHFELNTEGIDYFLGDLHGCRREFLAELTRVKFDNAKDRVFCVGDLVDRGENSVGCLKFLYQPWFHCVLGNHEEFMLSRASSQSWICNGGEWHLDVNLDDLEEYRDLVERKCSLTLTVDTEFGKVGVVHAESKSDWLENNEGSREVNLWSRSKYRSKDNSLTKNIDLVIVGHTVVQDVGLRGNTLYIDTGCVFGDPYSKLTMLTAKEAFDYLPLAMDAA